LTRGGAGLAPRSIAAGVARSEVSPSPVCAGRGSPVQCRRKIRNRIVACCKCHLPPAEAGIFAPVGKSHRAERCSLRSPPRAYSLSGGHRPLVNPFKERLSPGLSPEDTRADSPPLRNSRPGYSIEGSALPFHFVAVASGGTWPSSNTQRCSFSERGPNRRIDRTRCRIPAISRKRKSKPSSVDRPGT